MNRSYIKLMLLFLFVALPACRDAGSAQDDHGHSHGPGAGHSHGSAETGERPTVAVTQWTDRSELFMEYPLFVAGETGRAAIHVTSLVDFSPLSDGQVVVELRGTDGNALEFRDGPSSPGIFGVDMKVDRPGVYDMSLRVESASVQDVHELGPVTVYVSGASLPAQPEEGESISFLKEQQWTLDFGTAEAVERGIRASITVPAIVEPRSGGDALLSAPVPGRIDPAETVPVPGTRVRSGRVLARIIPRSDDLQDGAALRAVLVGAEQDHQLVLQARDRTERLVSARAVPRRRLEEAQAALIASKARLEAAREHWAHFESLSQSADGDAQSTRFNIRAPFDGVISEVRYAAGVSVEADEPLMRIVDPDHLHVVGEVPESLARNLTNARGAELSRSGSEPLDLGVPLTTNPVIDPLTRTAEIRFAVDNDDPGLSVGQAVSLRLFLGDERATTAIPESAVVDDAGRPVVFVQTGGESFVRRPVQLGDAAAGFVQVISGIEAGERVVSRGAYLVRLASASTQIPSHGHVH